MRLKETEYPYFTQTGTDRESDPDQYIANMKHGAVAGFKYFDFDADKPSSLCVTVKGPRNGRMLVYTEMNPFEKGDKAKLVAEIAIKPVEAWCEMKADLAKLTGTQALYFKYEGEGYVDFKSFCLG